MATDISITALKMQCTEIIKLTSATDAYGKSAEGLQGRLIRLSKVYYSMKVEVTQIERTLDDAQAGYERFGDAASEAASKLASPDFLEGVQSLQAVSREAQFATKKIAEVHVEQSKLSNKAGGIREAFGELRESSKWGDLTAMLGDSLFSATGAVLNSALGNETGTMVSTVLSSTAKGAVLGTASGVPGGTIIGAGIGAISGGIEAATQYFKSVDDAFKAARQSEYERVTQRKQADLSAGIGIAAQREVDEATFTNLLGSKSEADNYLKWVRDTANNTPFEYEDLSSMSKTLNAYQYSPEEMKKVITALGDTGTKLGAGSDELHLMLQGLGEMKQSGAVTQESLNPMLERNVPVWEYLREGFSKELGRELSVEEVQEMSSNNELDGGLAAEILVEKMAEDNAGAMSEMSKTYSGLLSKVEGMNQDRQSAMGEGYTAERSKGLQGQVDYYDQNGGQLDEANRLMGVYQANLENQQEEKVREAERVALADFEQKKAARYADIDARTDLGDVEKQQEKIRAESELGAEAGRMISEARVQAEVEYREGPAYQLYQETEKKLVGNLGQILKTDWNLFGYDMGNEFNKGLISTLSVQEIVEYFQPGLENYRQYKQYREILDQMNGNTPPKTQLYGTPSRREDNSFVTESGKGSAKAFGLAYVPYNDYPARLHEGERVLTAQENRTYNSRSTGNITINMVGPVVREETDVAAVARVIAAEVVRACDLM